jgi:hypothetical protein
MNIFRFFPHFLVPVFLLISLLIASFALNTNSPVPPTCDAVEAADQLTSLAEQLSEDPDIESALIEIQETAGSYLEACNVLN